MFRLCRRALAAAALLSSSAAAQAAGPAAAYRDPDAPLERRVQDLIARMTLEEKVSQLQYTSAAIPRLGVPEYNWWNEALHGVARAGRATVFPQAIGLAATWDTALIRRIGATIAVEARAKHHEAARQGRRGIYEGLTFWSPNINIFRDPRWGRGMETYGEDPHLAGRLAVAFVRGLQGDDPRYLAAVATPKHFAVHSGPEPDRHRFDAVVSREDLRDTYLPHFETAMREGGAWSIMCAYNRVYGHPACASSLLLDSVLRRAWGFTGYVVSDCWAVSDIHTGHRTEPDEVHAAAAALKAGTDLSCGPEYASLTKAVAQGLVTEAQVDTALARLLRARFRLGVFDPPERLPFPAARPDAPPAMAVITAASHRALALEAARKSLVLLKNEGGALPLRRDLGTIAVIGPNADDLDLLLGNYNGMPVDPVTPLEGIRRAVAPGAQVLYAPGADVAPGMPSLAVVPSGALDVRGEYFANHEFAGPPALRRDDAAVDFTWWDTVPARGLPADSFAVRWTGTLTGPVTGSYGLGVRAAGGVRLFLDDSLLVEFSERHVVLTQWTMVDLTAGVPRRLRLDYVDRRADAIVQLVWAVPNPRLREEALEAARRADAVVMMLGLSPRLEGEEMTVNVPGFTGGDRTSLDLPATQRELLEAVVAVGKPTVLVLLNGSAVAVNWAAEHVPAILEAWYPGQAAGTAIADVLFGHVSPGGRLPVTFYRSVDELPRFDDYGMAGRTYRHFTGTPLFPFGHGLSYSTFAYENLRVPVEVRAGDTLRVSVEVANTGTRAADEVVQLYVIERPGSRGVRTLAGFQRVSLSPGERTSVRFAVAPRHLSGGPSALPGELRLSVGGKQPGFTGVADASTTEVRTASLRVVLPER
jgi:beta-glucosidase